MNVRNTKIYLASLDDNGQFCYQRFAQLVRDDERGAIAALVEADGRVHEKAPDFVWAKTLAKLIRARGNYES